MEEVWRDRDRERVIERETERAMLRFLHPTVFDFHSEPSNYVSQPIIFKTYATLTSFLSFETEKHLD